MPGIKDLLAYVPLYVGLQRGLGADRLRYRCIEELDLHDGDVVLDVGCGPAYYYGRLPKVRYFGFDTSQRYIDWATKRWGGDNTQFRCEIFGDEHLSELPPVNAVMLLGLLHHMSDDQSRKLLQLASRALAPDGVVISVDTCFEPSQGAVSRWMSRNDRGEHVREPEQFVALAEQAFGKVDGEVVSGVTRIPSSHWMMRMRMPVLTADSVEADTGGQRSS
jgi:SAM-dependent methyltransferase